MPDPGRRSEAPRPIERRLRDLVEPVAAAIYFAPEANERYRRLGLDPIPGYFCSRGGCLGRVSGAVVAAAFAAFNPDVVVPAVTTGWATVDPEAVLGARRDAAADQLRRLLGEPGPDVERATVLLRRATDGIDGSGRPIFSGLRALPWPDSPWGALWRAADLVREHRGDGHVAAWIPHLDSVEVTLLTELRWGLAPGSYVATRGWSTDDVDDARRRLRDRGLLGDDATLSADGRALREEIEVQTDRTVREVVRRLGDDVDELLGLLVPWSRAIVSGGGYPVDFERLRGSDHVIEASR